MSYRLLTKKLLIANKKFVTRKELREYCKTLKITYESAISYLLSNKYVERTFRGIFYVKSIEERKLGISNMTFFEVMKEAMKIKGIPCWYFGLESALKLNNLTHEYFTIEFIVSEKIRRPKPIEILGHKVRFLAIKKSLTAFGINKEPFPYSDTEKTILDIAYFGIYRGLSKYAIKNNLVDYVEKCNRKKLLKYAENYPKSVLILINSIKNDKKRSY